MSSNLHAADALSKFLAATKYNPQSGKLNLGDPKAVKVAEILPEDAGLRTVRYPDRLPATQEPGDPEDLPIEYIWSLAAELSASGRAKVTLNTKKDEVSVGYEGSTRGNGLYADQLLLAPLAQVGRLHDVLRQRGVMHAWMTLFLEWSELLPNDSGNWGSPNVIGIWELGDSPSADTQRIELRGLQNSILQISNPEPVPGQAYSPVLVGHGEHAALLGEWEVWCLSPQGREVMRSMPTCARILAGKKILSLEAPGEQWSTSLDLV